MRVLFCLTGDRSMNQILLRAMKIHGSVMVEPCKYKGKEVTTYIVRLEQIHDWLLFSAILFQSEQESVLIEGMGGNIYLCFRDDDYLPKEGREPIGRFEEILPIDLEKHKSYTKLGRRFWAIKK
jgi:hypothetical protein